MFQVYMKYNNLVNEDSKGQTLFIMERNMSDFQILILFPLLPRIHYQPNLKF